MKPTNFASAFMFLLLAGSAVPAHAQSVNACVTQASVGEGDVAARITALSRAKNLARQAAEAANGGLDQYRAEDSMYGPIGQTPCTPNETGSWTFTFKGTAPGSSTPFVESVVTVDSQTGNVTVDRNTRLP